MALSIDFMQYMGWDDRTINLMPFIHDNKELMERIILKINSGNYPHLERILKKTFIQYGKEYDGGRYLIYELSGYEYHCVIGASSLEKEFIKKF